MSGRRRLPVIGAVAASPFVLILGIALAATSGSATGATSAAAATAAICGLTPAEVGAEVGDGSTLDADQIGNARIIHSVGVSMNLPERAMVIAIATAMQESSLRNLTTAVDLDSLGLFQQRPSQGWGSPAELTDPTYASKAFYQRLVQVPGWETLPLTQAAQAVQLSNVPDAYAQWEPIAIQLVTTFTGATAACATGNGDAGPSADPVPLPPGFTLPPETPQPVSIAVAWALQQLGTPYSWGGSCTAAHSGDPAKQCDCSSLMQQAYRAGGVTLSRTTFEQVYEGVPVYDLNTVRPGDLLFKAGTDGTASSPGHVGMYIGEGLIVHAPRTGDVVKIVSFESWRAEIVAVRRLAP